jgi:hypothetical protein
MADTYVIPHRINNHSVDAEEAVFFEEASSGDIVIVHGDCHVFNSYIDIFHPDLGKCCLQEEDLEFFDEINEALKKQRGSNAG